MKSSFDLLKECNITLDSLRTRDYRFVAWIIYSTQHNCFIAGIDTMSNDEQNLLIVLAKRTGDEPFYVIKDLLILIKKWEDNGAIPLEEAPFFD